MNREVEVAEVAKVPEVGEAVEVAQEQDLDVEQPEMDAQEAAPVSCSVEHIDLHNWVSTAS